ncbi:hypothetical protein E4656_17580 [Natronospirillum operosum]|uniref:Uncharacterized protein n=1 Tax=Natronospirillum operosum TaxID=2759953 RepID=A0A4Z0WAM5_9GAMM|nr:hypothetical protein [Natronospirillum operosum]TGG90746.1 hypothetical protein E4656_17580 [Natronospirillum operosum]
MTATPTRRLRDWLRRQASQAARHWSLFTSGSLLLMGGLFLIIMSERLLTPSLQQELVAALGVLIAAIGALRAIYGYLCIGLFKLLKYFLSDD